VWKEERVGGIGFIVVVSVERGEVVSYLWSGTTQERDYLIRVS